MCLDTVIYNKSSTSYKKLIASHLQNITIDMEKNLSLKLKKTVLLLLKCNHYRLYKITLSIVQIFCV